jgi:cardiolipin synthase
MTLDFSHKFYRTTSEALSAMHEAILAAQKSIYWEIYSLIDDTVGRSFIDILCQKAQAGLEVKIIVDAIGSYELSRLSISRLRNAGVDVVFYHSLLPGKSKSTWFRSIWHRNHRKILVVDKEVVFIGGVNVAAIYSQWDDLHVRLSGKVVSPLLRAFAKSYIRSGGDKKNVRHLLRSSFRKDWDEFKNRCKFILHSPFNLKKTSVKKIFINGLSKAQVKFNLLTPYFSPDRNFFKLISKAKNRGVEVNLFLPLRSDYRVLAWIADFYARWARRAGASVFFSRKMNHGKAMTVDSHTGFIGSVNFTPRSFYYNEESGILFKDESMVKELNSIFEDLRANSIQLNEENHSPATWRTKFKDWCSKQMGDWI